MLCAGCLLTAGAQTFTQRLQEKGRTGEGTVTVTHDKAIDDLVNKTLESLNSQPKQTADRAKETTATTNTPDKPAAKPTVQQEQKRDTVEQMIDSNRKVMVNSYKVNGFRVQAFAGGNQRKDRQKAEQTGSAIKAAYPTVPIYVHFNSPRWICRVGNYRTYEEAQEMLENIQKLGIKGAIIVKGKITVQD